MPSPAPPQLELCKYEVTGYKLRKHHLKWPQGIVTWPNHYLFAIEFVLPCFTFAIANHAVTKVFMHTVVSWCVILIVLFSSWTHGSLAQGWVISSPCCCCSDLHPGPAWSHSENALPSHGQALRALLAWPSQRRPESLGPQARVPKQRGITALRVLRARCTPGAQPWLSLAPCVTSGQAPWALWALLSSSVTGRCLCHAWRC